MNLQNTISFLQQMIQIPSLSKEENLRGDFIESFLKTKNISVVREKNNLWAKNKYFDNSKPTILLNSHIDTVRPNGAYTRDPFNSEVIDNKLFGLGSNDAGASVATLLSTFVNWFEKENCKYNLIFALTAEEEIFGANGMTLLISKIPKIDFAIVGEPTSMKLAIAEKGLLVLDCIAKGDSGHAAHHKSKNSILVALKDIEWFSKFRFEKISPSLGEVKMTVTSIEGGKEHNVVPVFCKFVVDIRVTDFYTHEEILEIIKNNISCEIIPRSLGLRPSSVELNHPIISIAQELNIETFGSPTMSDQAHLNCQSVKIGPGNTLRSHTADEFVKIDEIESGLKIYNLLLERLLL